MPTPGCLRDRLRSAAGTKERFGSTAAEVLDTAALIAAADRDWDKAAIGAFQEQQGIHQKVWGKLVSIACSASLKALPLDTLPASYTALYALVVMSPEELKAANAEGVIRANSSSRSILEWTKAFRLRGTGIEQEVSLTLVLKEELIAEQQQELLAALKQLAKTFGADLVEGKGGVKQASLKIDRRKALAEQIEEELMREIGEVVVTAPDALKSQFKVGSAVDLITGSREQFTGFFQVLEGKVREVFWEKYGRAYCLKIARDFNVTVSRAERYQLKKRLDAARDKWGSVIDGLKATTDHVQSKYMSF